MKKLKISILSALLCSFSFVFQAHSETAVEYEFSQAELDQILAPIALYPDTVLSHVLIASTYPLEVIQAERWTRENPSLEGDAALKAVENKDWDPSVIALVPFPQILKQMSEDLDWMQKLGDAFLQNEELVLASIQDLRQRAYDEGSLKNLEHLKVSQEENQIVIEPSVREVVYVPYYDTRVVYGNWWWVDYPPVYWAHHNHYYSGASFYWGPSIYVGTGFYFSSVHWHNHRVVVVDRHYARRHHYYSGRQVVRNADSRDWVHNTRHRRGVEYRHPRVSERNHSVSYRSQRNAQQVSNRLQNNSRTSVYENRNQQHAERVRAEASNSRVKNEGSNKWNRVEGGKASSARAENLSRQAPTRQTQVNTASQDREGTTVDRRTSGTPQSVVRQAQPTRTYQTERSATQNKYERTTYDRKTSDTKSYDTKSYDNSSNERSSSNRSSNNSRTSSGTRSERSASSVSRHSRTNKR